MKNLKLFIFAIGIVMMGFFTSCQSDKSVALPVTISFDKTNALDSAYTNEGCVISGSVTTDAKINSIQFFSNYFVNDIEKEIEIAGTKVTNVTANPYQFSLTVPGISKDTKITVKVTDNDGNVTSSSPFTVKELKMNISKFKAIQMGGWNSNYGSGVDLHNGTPWGGSKLSSHKDEIDAFFENSELASWDLDAVTFYPEYYDGARYNDQGTKFAKTSITPAQFDAMRRDILFKDLTATSTSVSPIAEGDVIFFQTKDGKKGLLKIITMTATDGDLLVDEIIQK
ncbi:MAG: hypothetical protein Q8862_09505 [Bacteroidota bacterium]|nr:hypothetical protein [Bacteroidota bacterium]